MIAGVRMKKIARKKAKIVFLMGLVILLPGYSM
jgi:hypothetical protein